MKRGFAAILAGVVGAPTVVAQPPLTGGERALEQRPVRVAVLNLGPTGDDGPAADESIIGLHIAAQDFRDALPLLDEDWVDVVVIRVSSWGGVGAEAAAFDEVFARQYAPWFRTVAWVHEASGATARAIWGIRELYMAPGARLGAALDWGGGCFGPSWPVPKPEDERMRMRAVSLRVGRDPAIMRSMMSLTPLSADADAAGRITWRQDTLGSSVLCGEGRILDVDASTAVRFEVARAVAASREELARAMDLPSVEWCGTAAGDLIDARRVERRKAAAELERVFTEYQACVQRASLTPSGGKRTEQLRRARDLLDALRIRLSDPSAAIMIGLSGAQTQDWIREQLDLFDRIEASPVAVPPK